VTDNNLNDLKKALGEAREATKKPAAKAPAKKPAAK
jgi:hypothetical protein